MRDIMSDIDRSFSMFKPREKVVCADGFIMSVQASRVAYCEPRVCGADEYTSVEVGFPSEVEPLLLEYMDGGPESPTQQVYGWVPASVIIAVIAKHGGQVGGELPPLKEEECTKD